jgi:DNA-binding response OmpR family regulator
MASFQPFRSVPVNQAAPATYRENRSDSQLTSDLQLTKKETRLLEVLTSNPGVCLSRGYLLRTVWGYKEGVRTRTVDVHIQRLRKKLGPQGEEHIKTIFRSGYVWYS